MLPRMGKVEARKFCNGLNMAYYFACPETFGTHN